MAKIIKESNGKKDWLILTGFLLFTIGFILVLYDSLSIKNINNIEEESLRNFKVQEKLIIDNNEIETPVVTKNQNLIEYIASISIPKINLERGLVSPNSYLNNVEYNIEILNSSDYPDKENGNVILAAHSGNSRVSYFKNLDKLDLEDLIKIEYKSNFYIYHVTNIYDIEKTGKATIIRNPGIKTLTLITCRNNTNRQIVVISELVKEVSING